MADTHNTNNLVDLKGLNKAYNTNKKRIDNLVKGNTASKYAELIGSSGSEGSVSPSTIGTFYNPVYVDNGKIKPMVANTGAPHSISLGNENTQNINLGGDSNSVANVKSKDFTASNSVNASVSVNSPEIKVQGSSKSVSLKYDDDLDALVFNFN